MSINEKYLECIEHLNEEEIIEFLTKLIKTESYPPDFNEKRVALIVQDKFSEHGIKSTIDDLDYLEGLGRANLISSIGKSNKPHLVYSGHFDTVPQIEEGWKYGAFSAEIKDGKMYGRGTADMKAGVVAQVMAMCIFKKANVELNGKLSFVGTAGEEVGCQGARLYREKYGNDHIDALAISEASDKQIYLAERGALWIKFISYGKAAHPGIAHEGVNALLNMLNFFEIFKDYEFKVDENKLLGKPNLNVTTMHAGTITNALPIKCEATVDIRTVPGVVNQDILDVVENIITDLKKKNDKFNMEYEVINDFIPIETKESHPFIQTAIKSYKEALETDAPIAGIHYFTDAVEIIKGNEQIPLIIYGPGNPNLNHKVDEFVELKDVVDATKYYIRLALNYLN